MKVYELINQLSKIPAGYNIILNIRIADDSQSEFFDIELNDIDFSDTEEEVSLMGAYIK